MRREIHPQPGKKSRGGSVAGRERGLADGAPSDEVGRLCAGGGERQAAGGGEGHARAEQVVGRNVRTIVALEQAALRERTAADRVIDAITAFCGSLKFVAFHVVFFGLWIGVNLSPVESLRFDPFPFGLLTMWVSMEAIFLATFILITQNRQARLADRRNHLDLQFTMLAEQEVTKVLEMVEAIYRRLRLGQPDPEIDALKQATDPETVAEHIDYQVEQQEEQDGASRG